MTETLAFKPYPCGTMAHPFIDCARKLRAQGIKPADIKEMVCETAEGIVHRLWEPLADKQQPKNGYAAKFSIPYLLATGLVRGDVGFEHFTEAAVRDPDVLAAGGQGEVRGRSRTIPIPHAFTGHIRATLNDGRVVEVRQPHFRGGAKEPLTRQDIEDKFTLNVRHGGWRRRQGRGRAGDARQAFRRQDRSDRRCGDSDERDNSSGKVAIVTGAGRNIGRAIALALAGAGAAVAVVARSNKAEADAVVSEIEKTGGKALAQLADIADAKAVQAIADAALKKFGRIDCLDQQRRAAPREDHRRT